MRIFPFALAMVSLYILLSCSKEQASEPTFSPEFISYTKSDVGGYVFAFARLNYQQKKLASYTLFGENATLSQTSDSSRLIRVTYNSQVYTYNYSINFQGYPDSVSKFSQNDPLNTKTSCIEYASGDHISSIRGTLVTAYSNLSYVWNGSVLEGIRINLADTTYLVRFIASNVKNNLNVDPITALMLKSYWMVPDTHGFFLQMYGKLFEYFPSRIIIPGGMLQLPYDRELQLVYNLGSNKRIESIEIGGFDVPTIRIMLTYPR